MATGRSYHHGDLRRAVLAAAVEAIVESGPAAISLRDLARRAGVSHAAPAHHFGDKAGVLTALAIDGYRLLADALDAAGECGGSPDALGVAYVRFALDHRGHFAVMFRPELYRAEEPQVREVQQHAYGALSGALAGLAAERGTEDADLDAVAAWSLMHGFATLWLNGALPAGIGDLDRNPEDVARALARRLLRGLAPPPGR